jgi:hypothetical protein
VTSSFFVDYYVCAGTVAHETFTSRLSMRLFMRSLAANVLIAWGRL